LIDWHPFLRTLLWSFGALVLAVYLLIVLVDPYGNMPFSLDLPRAPISTNQRFAYPALARDERFDSVIIGSSTLRLLDPENLDRETGARFANLAMNSATAYEQMRLHDLFMRHHPNTAYVVIGIDDSWCRREATYEKYTFRQFPEWMYDDNPWNDLLYMFNDKALENTVRLLELIAGKRSPKYETNGYQDFTVDFGAYDPVAVARRLYPRGKPAARRIPAITPGNEHPEWRFAAHELLQQMLRRTPKTTRTLLVFPPMHGDYLARSEVLYRECKGRIEAIAKKYNARTIDFMVDSPITRNDDNYWDPLHYRSGVARKVESDIAEALRTETTR